MIGNRREDALTLHAEEACLLWQTRQHLARRPLTPLVTLARMDRRIRGHLWSLVAAGPVGRRIASAQRTGDPGEDFVRAFLAIHDQDRAAIAELLDSTPPRVAVIGGALQWFKPEPLMVRARWLVGLSVDRLEPEVEGALRTCGLLREDPPPRGDAPRLFARARPGEERWEEALALWACMVAPEELECHVATLLDSLGSSREAVQVVALALLPGFGDWLLDVITDHAPLARLAGMALHLITALDIASPQLRLTPCGRDEDDPDADLPRPAPGPVLAWWGQQLALAARRERVLLGRGLDGAWAAQVLREGPQLARALASAHLSVAFGHPRFDVRAPYHHQIRRLWDPPALPDLAIKETLHAPTP